MYKRQLLYYVRRQLQRYPVKHSGRFPGSNDGFRPVSYTHLKKVVCAGGTYEARTVVIATGASHRKLGVPGEEQLTGIGVSYCATCDGAFFRGKTTAVVGGGDVALEDAIFLARLCKKVYVIHRRNEFRGARSLQKKLLSLENVEIVWDSVAEEIIGSDQDVYKRQEKNTVKSF